MALADVAAAAGGKAKIVRTAAGWRGPLPCPTSPGRCR